jgi:succinoglycan biosynthesis transport protein ExoP
VVAAPEEATQVQPRPARNGFFGLIVGLMLGLGAAFARDALDTRVRSSEEAEAALGLPILSRIRRPRGRGAGADAVDLTMRASPGGLEAEGFRILRANLSFGLLAHKVKTVMVTSAIQGEGKSTTVANLAVALALSGKRVALVELDFRRPSLARLFGLADQRGLTSIAIAESDLDSAVHRIELPQVSGSLSSSEQGELVVLTSGPLPPDPAEFIGTDAVKQIVERLAAEYDYVLLDSPPIVTVSDATLIAGLADAAFVCVRIGVVTRPLLHETHRALDRLPLPVLGLVITGADSDDAVGYGQYGYGANSYVAAGASASGKSSD